MTAILFPRKLVQLNDVISAGIQPGDTPIYDGASFTFGPGGGGGGAFSGGVSNLGNTLGDTGITGSQLVLAGINGITLSQATGPNGGTVTVSGITQSVQTQDRFDLTLAGNTAGALQLVSSGTMTLAGGANITLSQNGNAISIIGGAGAGGTQTGISGIANSETTYTSGTVSLSELGAITIRSTTGNQFQLSVNPQSVQPETQTFVGGVAASNTTFTSGTVTIVGSGNITVASGTGQRIIISGSQSVQPETQSFVGGLAGSNTTYTSGTITITGVGGGVTVSSNTGQRIDISVAAPVAQTGTQFSAGISGGNTSGQSGTVAGRVVLAGGNNITLSGSSNGASETITISAASQTLQTSNVHNVTLSGNTSGVMAQVSSGTMTLAGGNNITLSQAGNAITISGANVGGAQTGISGIAGSNTTYTSGSVTFTGVGGGVTVSSNTGQRIDISVAAPVAQTNQAGSIFAIGNTTSSSSGTYDARTLSISGAGIISVAATNSGWKISANAQTGISSIVASDATYTSGSVQFTGSNMVTVRSSANQRVVIDASQSVQTQNMVAVTLSGNTSGAQALISSGTMTLAGGNNITVSQAGNAVTISGANVGGAQTGISGLANSQTTYTSGTVSMSELGAITIRSTTGNQYQFSVNAQSVQPETQTFVGGIANSQTTYTSGTVSLSELGAITIRSTTGNQFQLSVNAQSVQTQSLFSAGVSTGGNTAGDTGVTGTRLVFVGSNNITLSQATAAAGGTVTISGPTTVAQTNQSGGAYAVGNTYSSSSGTFDARTLSIRGDGIISIAATNSGWRISASQSVQPETQTFVGGIAASNTTYTSGTITITGVGGGVTVSSNTGQRVDISVAAQSVQPVMNLVVSNTTFSSGTVSLSGFGDVTVNTAANIIRISAPVQTAETAISGIANSQTTYTSGTVSLSELGAITIRSTTGNQFQLSVNAQTEQTQSRFNLTISGNTAGAGALISSGVMTLAGGNNVTLSQAGNAITISGGAGGAFSAGVSTGGNTAGDTGVTGSRLVFVGTNNITLSQATAAAGGTVTISGPTQTNDSGGVYAVGNTYSTSSGTFDVRTLSIRGDGIISVAASNSGWRISASQSVQPETQTFVGGLAASNTTYTSGTITITGVGGGVTVSSNTGQRIDISVAAPVAQSTQPGVQHFVVSNTTFSSGTVSISGFGDVTVNTAANIIRISAPVQTAQTGISGLANSQTTYTSGTVSLSELGAITIRSTTGNQYQFSVNSQTLQTSNVHNVTLSGNTAGAMAQISSGTMTLAGGNGITLSQAGNAVTISGGGGGAFSAGVSTGGNTQGNTGVTGTRLVFVGTNNITLSQNTDANGGTISISGQSPAGGAFSGGASNLGNTAGATGISGTQMVLVGSGVMSLSQTTGANGNTVSILAPAASVLSAVAPLSTSTNGSTISILGPATSSLVGVSGISVSSNGSTISLMQTTGSGYLTSFSPYDESPMVTGQQGQATLHMMPVRFPEAVAFDRIALGVQISNATNSSGSITISQWVGMYSRTASSLNLASSTSISTNFTGSGTVSSYSSYGGPRWHTIGWTQTATEGDWFVGIVMRTTTGGAAGHTVSQLLLSKFTNSAWSGILGASQNATAQHLLGQGVYTVSTSGMPATIAFTQLNGTGSDALRAPIWHMRSGTV